MKVLRMKRQCDLTPLPCMHEPDVLANREKDIYLKIWQQPDEASQEPGHPFIVQLHFFCEWEKGRKFKVPREAVEDTTSTMTARGNLRDRYGNDEFHMGLMMEFCPLGSLDAFVKKELDRRYRKQDFNWLMLIRRFLSEVLLALDFLHTKKNVVYRDLKLENVLVVRGEDEKLHVKIADFGFGKILHSSRPDHSAQMSMTGTPYWMSPEMAKHMRLGQRFRMTRREQQGQDMYQFGTLVFRLAYGTPLPTHQILYEDSVETEEDAVTN